MASQLGNITSGSEVKKHHQSNKEFWITRFTKGTLSIVPDVMKSQLPEFADDMLAFKKSVFEEGGTINDAFIALRESAKIFKKKIVDDAIVNGTKNLITDIASGNINNQKRIEEADAKLMGSDMSFDDRDDFGGMDESMGDNSNDFGDMEGFDIDTSMPEESPNADVVDAVKGSASSTLEAMSAVSDGITNTIKKSSMAATKVSAGLITIMGQNILSSMNKQYEATSELVKFNSEIATDFYNKTFEYQNKMLEAQASLGKSLEDIKLLIAEGNEFSGVYKNKDKSTNRQEKTLAERISGWTKEVTAEDSPLAMMIGDIVNNPTGYLFREMILPGMLSENTKKSFNKLNKKWVNMKSRFGKNLLGKLASSENGLFRMIGEKLGELLPTDKTERVESVESKIGAYEKGQIPFDGITKKAITDIIPYYLKEILAYTKGSKGSKRSDDVMIFDYQKGVFLKEDVLRKEAKKELEDNYAKTITSVVNNLHDDKVSGGLQPLLKEAKKILSNRKKQLSDALKISEDSIKVKYGIKDKDRESKELKDARKKYDKDVMLLERSYADFLYNLMSKGPEIMDIMTRKMDEKAKIREIQMVLSEAATETGFMGFDAFSRSFNAIAKETNITDIGQGFTEIRDAIDRDIQKNITSKIDGDIMLQQLTSQFLEANKTIIKNIEETRYGVIAKIEIVYSCDNRTAEKAYKKTMALISKDISKYTSILSEDEFVKIAGTYIEGIKAGDTETTSIGMKYQGLKVATSKKNRKSGLLGGFDRLMDYIGDAEFVGDAESNIKKGTASAGKFFRNLFGMKAKKDNDNDMYSSFATGGVVGNVPSYANGGKSSGIPVKPGANVNINGKTYRADNNIDDTIIMAKKGEGVLNNKVMNELGSGALNRLNKNPSLARKVKKVIGGRPNGGPINNNGVDVDMTDLVEPIDRIEAYIKDMHEWSGNTYNSKIGDNPVQKALNFMKDNEFTNMVPGLSSAISVLAEFSSQKNIDIASDKMTKVGKWIKGLFVNDPLIPPPIINPNNNPPPGNAGFASGGTIGGYKTGGTVSNETTVDNINDILSEQEIDELNSNMTFKEKVLGYLRKLEQKTGKLITKTLYNQARSKFSMLLKSAKKMGIKALEHGKKAVSQGVRTFHVQTYVELGKSGKLTFGDLDSLKAELTDEEYNKVSTAIFNHEIDLYESVDNKNSKLFAGYIKKINAGQFPIEDFNNNYAKFVKMFGQSSTAKLYEHAVNITNKNPGLAAKSKALFAALKGTTASLFNPLVDKAKALQAYNPMIGQKTPGSELHFSKTKILVQRGGLKSKDLMIKKDEYINVFGIKRYKQLESIAIAFDKSMLEDLNDSQQVAMQAMMKEVQEGKMTLKDIISIKQKVIESVGEAGFKKLLQYSSKQNLGITGYIQAFVDTMQTKAKGVAVKYLEKLSPELARDLEANSFADFMDKSGGKLAEKLSAKVQDKLMSKFEGMLKSGKIKPNELINYKYVIEPMIGEVRYQKLVELAADDELIKGISGKKSTLEKIGGAKQVASMLIKYNWYKLKINQGFITARDFNSGNKVDSDMVLAFKSASSGVAGQNMYDKLYAYAEKMKFQDKQFTMKNAIDKGKAGLKMAYEDTAEYLKKKWGNFKTSMHFKWLKVKLHAGFLKLSDVSEGSEIGKQITELYGSQVYNKFLFSAQQIIAEQQHKKLESMIKLDGYKQENSKRAGIGGFFRNVSRLFTYKLAFARIKRDINKGKLQYANMLIPVIKDMYVEELGGGPNAILQYDMLLHIAKEVEQKKSLKLLGEGIKQFDIRKPGEFFLQRVKLAYKNLIKNPIDLFFIKKRIRTGMVSKEMIINPEFRKEVETTYGLKAYRDLVDYAYEWENTTGLKKLIFGKSLMMHFNTITNMGINLAKGTLASLTRMGKRVATRLFKGPISFAYKKWIIFQAKKGLRVDDLESINNKMLLDSRYNYGLVGAANSIFNQEEWSDLIEKVENEKRKLEARRRMAELNKIKANQVNLNDKINLENKLVDMKLLSINKRLIEIIKVDENLRSVLLNSNDVRKLSDTISGALGDPSITLELVSDFITRGHLLKIREFIEKYEDRYDLAAREERISIYKDTREKSFKKKVSDAFGVVGNMFKMMKYKAMIRGGKLSKEAMEDKEIGLSIKQDVGAENWLKLYDYAGYMYNQSLSKWLIKKTVSISLIGVKLELKMFKWAGNKALVMYYKTKARLGKVFRYELYDPAFQMRMTQTLGAEKFAKFLDEMNDIISNYQKKQAEKRVRDPKINEKIKQKNKGIYYKTIVKNAKSSGMTVNETFAYLPVEAKSMFNDIELFALENKTIPLIQKANMKKEKKQNAESAVNAILNKSEFGDLVKNGEKYTVNTQDIKNNPQMVTANAIQALYNFTIDRYLESEKEKDANLKAMKEKAEADKNNANRNRLINGKYATGMNADGSFDVDMSDVGGKNGSKKDSTGFGWSDFALGSTVAGAAGWAKNKLLGAGKWVGGKAWGATKWSSKQLVTFGKWTGNGIGKMLGPLGKGAVGYLKKLGPKFLMKALPFVAKGLARFLPGLGTFLTAYEVTDWLLDATGFKSKISDTGSRIFDYFNEDEEKTKNLATSALDDNQKFYKDKRSAIYKSNINNTDDVVDKLIDNESFVKINEMLLDKDNNAKFIDKYSKHIENYNKFTRNYYSYKKGGDKVIQIAIEDLITETGEKPGEVKYVCNKLIEKLETIIGKYRKLGKDDIKLMVLTQKKAAGVLTSEESNEYLRLTTKVGNEIDRGIKEAIMAKEVYSKVESNSDKISSEIDRGVREGMFAALNKSNDSINKSSLANKYNKAVDSSTNLLLKMITVLQAVANNTGATAEGIANLDTSEALTNGFGAIGSALGNINKATVKNTKAINDSKKSKIDIGSNNNTQALVAKNV